MLKSKKKKLMLLGISLLAFTLLIVGCSEESSNQSPVIEDLDESTSGLEATITGSVSDSDGSVSEVEIAWGDENSDTVSSGFDEESHTYDSEGTYDVTVIATDDEGETTSQTISVKVVEHGEVVTVSAGTAADESTSIDYDIEMGKYEVTHAEFIEFLNDAGVASEGSYEEKEIIDMGSNDCAIDHDGSFYFAGSDHADDDEDTPVIMVTWYGALAYCNWLSNQKGLTPAYDLDNWELKDEPQNLEGYRLPTRTEWEYAARGGANGDNTTYAGSDTIDDVAWYYYNSDEKIHPVGEKQANELGIYDMSGNAMEWTNTNPAGSSRSRCGGSWSSYDYTCRVDGRNSSDPDYRSNDGGFRLTKTQ